MRAQLGFILLAVTATTLHGQRIGTNRFEHIALLVSAFTVGGSGAFDALPIAFGDAQPAPTVRSQVLAGFGGWLVGFVVGGLVGAAHVPVSNRGINLEAAVEVVGSGLLGAALDSAIGVQWHGKRHGMQSAFIATLGGSLLGTVIVPVSPLTSPLGATLAYNHFGHERVAP